MAELSDELRGQLVPTASGRLSLDREKAKDKLRKFRLPDPHFYVLQFVRAASVLGAKTIRFQVAARSMECWFDAELPVSLFDDIWGVAFGDQGGIAQQAANYIGLGIGSAQALKPRDIRIRSGHHELVVTEDSETYDQGEHVPFVDGTTIRLREKLKLSHLVESFMPRERLDEVRVLARHCARSDLVVSVNDTQVAAQWRPNSLMRRHESDERRTVIVLLQETPVGLVTEERPFTAEATPTAVHLVKHGVQVGLQYLPTNVIPADGTLYSRKIRTDLSGLSVVRDDVLDTAIREGPMSLYHDLVAELVETWSSSDAAPSSDIALSRGVVFRLLERFFEMVTELDPESIGPSPDSPLPDGTKRLMNALLEAPIFARARGEARLVSLREASRIEVPERIAISRARFPALESQGEPVIFLGGDDRPDWFGASRLFEAIRAVAAYVGVAVVDETDSLQRLHDRKRNVALWQSQPLRVEPSWPHQIEVTTEDGMTAVIYVAIRPEDGVPKLVPGRVGIWQYVESRLLEHRVFDSAPGIGVELDGAFRTNVRFDDVVRDEAFERLAIEILLRLPELFAEASRETLGETQAAAETVTAWVHGLVEGSIPFQLLTGLGIDSERVVELLERERPFALEYGNSVGEVLPATTYGVVVLAGMADVDPLEHLGAAAAFPSYILVSSEDGEVAQVSLEQIEAHEKPLLKIRAGGEWRSYLESAKTAGASEHDVLVVTEREYEILERLLPNVRDAREVLDSRLAEVRFLEKPLYEDIERPQDLHTESFETADGSIDVVVTTGQADGVYVAYLYEGRLLEREHVSSPLGSFRVVVRQRRLRPGWDWDNLLQGTTYAKLRAEIDEACRETLIRWWMAERRERASLSGSARALYFRVTAEEGRKGTRKVEPSVPAMRYEDAWERRLVSIAELRSQAETHGGVLAFSETMVADRTVLPAPAAWVVHLGFGVDAAVLNDLVEDVRWVDASIAGSSAASVRDRFRARDRVPFLVPGAGFPHRHLSDELEASFRLVPDASYGTGPSRVRATILYDDRKLEEAVIDVPFGRFRAVIRGSAIEPDPSFTFVSRGRAQVLEWLEEGAAETIRAACREFSVLNVGQVDAELEPVRSDLIRMLGKTESFEPPPPFDLRAALRAARLFRVATGRWVSAEDLDVLAARGALAYAFDDTSKREDVLWLERDQLELVQRSLPHQLVPVEDAPSGEEIGLSLYEVGRYSDDPLLNAIVSQLVVAQGGHFDVFDDRLARSVRWGDQIDGLCRVGSDGVTLRSDHRLVRRARERMDDVTIAFLTSVVFSSVNRHFEAILDEQEGEVQQAMLGARRPDS